MRLVIVESPFAPQTSLYTNGHEGGASHKMCRACLNEEQRKSEAETNLRYLRACMRDCLLREEAPFASHGLYTQPGVLDDTIAAEREFGIVAGFAWRDRANATVVYTDLGISNGMKFGITHAERMVEEGRIHVVEYRMLTGWK